MSEWEHIGGGVFRHVIPEWVKACVHTPICDTEHECIRVQQEIESWYGTDWQHDDMEARRWEQ